MSPFGKTIQDAVEFYAAFLHEKADKQKSQTLGNLMDDWLAEKKRRVEQNTMRLATYETLDVKANGLDGYKAKWGSQSVVTITREEIEGWIESRMVRLLNVTATLATLGEQMADEEISEFLKSERL